MAKDSTYCFKGTNDFYIENGIIHGYEAPYLTEHKNYGELILERLKSRPQFVGQVDGITGEEETFAMMLEKSVKCAIWLKKQNVKPGDVVGVCTHNQMDAYVPCLAALFIGAIFNPWWNHNLQYDEAKHFLTLTTPKVVFVNEKLAAMVLEASEETKMKPKIIVFGNILGFQSINDIFESEDGTIVSEFRCTQLSSVDDPAMICYTSGTTGLPKGALHSHRSLFGNVRNASRIGSSENVVTSLVFSAVSWISGVLAILRGIVAVERRIIYPIFDEEKTLQLIEKYEVNFLPIISSMGIKLQKCQAIPKYDLSSLKVIRIGGSVLKEKAQRAIAETFPHVTVVQVCGSTELGSFALQQSADYKFGSCGRLGKNLKMKVIDPESGRILGPNETGEACYKSPFMLTCYYRNPEQTKKTIDSEGWLHSGDLVHYDEEGHVFVTDRIKELIKCKLHHIAPAQIEHVLQTHPAVKECAVFPIFHDLDDEQPMAFVSKMPNTEVTKDELQKFVADALPDHMKLRGGVIFLDEIPHTSSGKVNRAELRKLIKFMPR